MPNRSDTIRAIAAAAEAWRDLEYPSREEAVRRTLETENPFTEEAVAFAVNQQMSLITDEALELWLRDRRSGATSTVGVLNPGNVPLAGLQDVLAVLLTGHAYLGTLSSRSPALLPAFVADVKGRLPTIRAGFDTADAVFERADALIATGSEETVEWVLSRVEDARLPEDRVLIRGHSFGVAVLDGHESREDLERLAEDVLLHEGYGCRSVAVIWAPAGHSPDDVLDAMAQFRGVFPAHESTPGRLKMQQAFLQAVDRSHAYGEGLEFLVSLGEPEEQPPGHVRWSEYDDLESVNDWLEAHSASVQLVVARGGLRPKLTRAVHQATLGEAQRPALDWCPDGIDTVAFLSSI